MLQLNFDLERDTRQRADDDDAGEDANAPKRGPTATMLTVARR